MGVKIWESDSQLWLSDGRLELAVPLNHGIRISHLALTGMENLLYEQPVQADYLCTPEGWRVYGGQRFWLAPEGPESYWPDNEPVRWTAVEDGVWLHQAEDPWLRVKKSVGIRYLTDGRVTVIHRVENTGIAPRSCAAWAVTTVAPGGRAMVPLLRDLSVVYNPTGIVSLWCDTNLHDPRLHFTGDSLTATHQPLREYLKLGLSLRAGCATLENRGQRFVKEFPWEESANYPDGGCNFELYLCEHMMELESLGPIMTLQPGETAEHSEIWSVDAL